MLFFKKRIFISLQFTRPFANLAINLLSNSIKIEILFNLINKKCYFFLYIIINNNLIYYLFILKMFTV